MLICVRSGVKNAVFLGQSYFGIMNDVDLAFAMSNLPLFSIAAQQF
jgi:hypothetical protein